MLVAATASTALLAAAALAHWVQPEEAIRRVESEESRKELAIEEVRRDPSLPRLLLIRVGPGWAKAPADKRIEAAERWQHAWSSSVHNGIVAIVDAASDKAVVNFDARGKATLK